MRGDGVTGETNELVGLKRDVFVGDFFYNGYEGGGFACADKHARRRN